VPKAQRFVHRLALLDAAHASVDHVCAQATGIALLRRRPRGGELEPIAVA
jgi:hypothetical protein